MIVPNEIRKCVAFVAIEMANGEMRMVGTAFFLSRHVEDRIWTYFVTAKHVIEGIRKNGLEWANIRVIWTGDESDKLKWLQIKLSDWKFHPTDDSIDVAVFAGNLPDSCDQFTYSISRIVSAEMVANEQVGHGTEVFITGLFVKHYGQIKNIPIVRIGNIAAMPEEQIDFKAGRFDAYLIEARSIGGLSGSPVFVNLEKIYSHRGQLRIRRKGTEHYLLGMMLGHWDAGASALDEAKADTTDFQRVNMGIGIVVPIEKIIEVISHHFIAKAEAE